MELTLRMLLQLYVVCLAQVSGTLHGGTLFEMHEPVTLGFYPRDIQERLELQSAHELVAISKQGFFCIYIHRAPQ